MPGAAYGAADGSTGCAKEGGNLDGSTNDVHSTGAEQETVTSSHTAWLEELTYRTHERVTHTQEH